MPTARHSPFTAAGAREAQQGRRAERRAGRPPPRSRPQLCWSTVTTEHDLQSHWFTWRGHCPPVLWLDGALSKCV